MIELFGSALATFLVIIDPPGCAPIFASLTRGASTAQRRSMAIRSAVIAWAVLMFFALLGRRRFRGFGGAEGADRGIDLGADRISLLDQFDLGQRLRFFDGRRRGRFRPLVVSTAAAAEQ